MKSDVKLNLILTFSEMLINKGLPLATKLISELNKKDIVSIKDIEDIKGKVDSATYFKED